MSAVGQISRRAALVRGAMTLPAIAGLRNHLLPQQEVALQMDAHDARLVTLQDCRPDRATYRPGEPALIQVALTNAGHGPASLTLEVRLVWLDEPVAAQQQPITVQPGDHTVVLPLALPAETFRGYGVDLTIRDAAGALLAESGTAVDVLDDWTQAPRYGFLSDFAPGDPFAQRNVAALARYHINVVQFYDWMWRHYELMPPHQDFTDALGRPLSLKTVREKVAACEGHGMAALGYAAVYGAEPEYALKHADEMLYDAHGEPYSLEKLFYLMNIHQGNPWRRRILAAMARAVREVPFDGLHLDQYGFPKDQAYGPPPRRAPYDLSADFPPFIDDARRAIRAARRGTRVIFNAVGNWPIETVTRSEQDATYIEVWPPFDTYSDLQTLILEARRLQPARQVILAAYLTPLLGALGDDLPPAETATRLAGAAIWANGGFHLLLGEHDGALCDPYYPKYATMMPNFAAVIRRYYDFVVRYENALSDPRLVTATGDDALAAVRLRGAPSSPFGEPGTVWTIARHMPGLRTASLINLTAATDANWNAPKPPPRELRDLEAAIRVDRGVRGVFIASPDGTSLAAHPLPHLVRQEGGERWAHVRVPRLEYWSLLVVKDDA